MPVLEVGPLPESPLAAAAAFHDRILPRALEQLAAETTRTLTLVFAPADHTHRAWRLAATQGLAREHAPKRINAVASDDPAAISATARHLAAAQGVTGQYFPLDSHGAGPVVKAAQ